MVSEGRGGEPSRDLGRKCADNLQALGFACW